MIQNPNLYNGMTLAYIGDAYFELLMRNRALEKGLTKVKKIHEFVIKRVCAKAQAKYMKELLVSDILTEEEKNIYQRGRNAHVASARKIDMVIYHEATGFEALIGYLFLNNNQKRIKDILDKLFDMEVMSDGEEK